MATSDHASPATSGTDPEPSPASSLTFFAHLRTSAVAYPAPRYSASSPSFARSSGVGSCSFV